MKNKSLFFGMFAIGIIAIISVISVKSIHKSVEIASDPNSDIDWEI